MPEISFFMFDLKQMFKVLPKFDIKFDKMLKEYEQNLEFVMAQNRLKLFNF